MDTTNLIAKALDLKPLTAAEFVHILGHAEQEIAAWKESKADKMPARRAKRAVEIGQNYLSDATAEELGEMTGIQDRLEAVCNITL